MQCFVSHVGLSQINRKYISPVAVWFKYIDPAGKNSQTDKYLNISLEQSHPRYNNDYLSRSTKASS